jgi:hypothetical protein
VSRPSSSGSRADAVTHRNRRDVGDLDPVGSGPIRGRVRARCRRYTDRSTPSASTRWLSMRHPRGRRDMSRRTRCAGALTLGRGGFHAPPR